MSENMHENEKKASFFSDRTHITILIAALIVITAIVSGIIIYTRKVQIIDVNSYIDVVFSGYNGAGEATIVLQKDRLDADIRKLARRGDEAVNVVADTLSYKVDKQDNLSLGEEVCVTLDYDNNALKNYQIKLIGYEKKVRVSNLEATKSIDPFDNVTVSFVGVAPNVKARFVCENEKIPSDYFSFDKQTGLKNGDQITLTILNTPDTSTKIGYSYTRTSKHFRVSGMQTYPQKLSDIPQDSLKQIKRHAKDLVQSYNNKLKKIGLKIHKIEYETLYFQTLKKLTGNLKQDVNHMDIVYKVTVTRLDNPDLAFDIYLPVRYDDLVIGADRRIAVDSLKNKLLGNLQLNQGDSIKGYWSVESYVEHNLEDKGEYSYQEEQS